VTLHVYAQLINITWPDLQLKCSFV